MWLAALAVCIRAASREGEKIDYFYKSIDSDESFRTFIHWHAIHKHLSTPHHAPTHIFAHSCDAQVVYVLVRPVAAQTKLQTVSAEIIFVVD